MAITRDDLTKYLWKEHLYLIYTGPMFDLILNTLILNKTHFFTYLNVLPPAVDKNYLHF